MTDESNEVLRGERVLLRRGAPDDVDRLVQIRSEPAVSRWWGDPEPEEVAGELIGRDDVFVIDVDGEVVGAIQYEEEDDPMYRHAAIDIFVTESRQRKGYGSDALRTLARHLFFGRGHHRLTVDPAAGNAAAIRTYERIGFRPVGVMRRYERGPDGTWRDGLLMDMLRDGWSELS